MRVVAKFAVAFIAAALISLAVFTYVLANREATRIEKTLTAGLVSYATGLRPALEAAWHEGGYEAVERIAGAFDPEGEVRAHVRRGPDTRPTPPSAVVVTRNDAARLLQARIELDGPEGRRAVLTLERAFVPRSTIVRDTLGEQIVAAAILASTMALLAALLGVLVVGSPLERIVRQARRIGAGDLTSRLAAERSDEIGYLERELNAMCDQLAIAKEQLEAESTARVETLEKLRHLDRLRTVGTIASGVAHELGTPLNVLLLRGQSLTKGELDDDEVRASGKAVVAQVEKMSRIVRQLLDFARQRSTPQSARARVDVAAVARSAASLLRALARKHAVSIVVREDARVYVRGDAGQLEQALTNLVVNGVQAMREGGRLDIRVAIDDDANAALLEVTDRGEGMTPEIRERIFDPFFTTKPRTEGTGLGLHVTRGIVEDHGGTISVSSIAGNGSTFSIRLPRAADEAPKASGAAAT